MNKILIKCSVTLVLCQTKWNFIYNNLAARTVSVHWYASGFQKSKEANKTSQKFLLAMLIGIAILSQTSVGFLARKLIIFTDLFFSLFEDCFLVCLCLSWIDICASFPLPIPPLPEVKSTDRSLLVSALNKTNYFPWNNNCLPLENWELFLLNG